MKTEMDETERSLRWEKGTKREPVTTSVKGASLLRSCGLGSE
jgi:hypothetical protein